MESHGGHDWSWLEPKQDSPWALIDFQFQRSEAVAFS